MTTTAKKKSPAIDPPLMTRNTVRAMGGCERGAQEFEERFPRGVLVTQENINRHRGWYRFSWLFGRVDGMRRSARVYAHDSAVLKITKPQRDALRETERVVTNGRRAIMLEYKKALRDYDRSTSSYITKARRTLAAANRRAINAVTKKRNSKVNNNTELLGLQRAVHIANARVKRARGF